MISKYWQFLNWLSAHKMYCLAWVIYHTNIVIALLTFTLAAPLLIAFDLLRSAVRWFSPLYKQGVGQLKKGRKND